MYTIRTVAISAAYRHDSNNARVLIGRDTMLDEMDLCCLGLFQHLYAVVKASTNLSFEPFIRINDLSA